MKDLLFYLKILQRVWRIWAVQFGLVEYVCSPRWRLCWIGSHRHPRRPCKATATNNGKVNPKKDGTVCHTGRNRLTWFYFEYLGRRSSLKFGLLDKQSQSVRDKQSFAWMKVNFRFDCTTASFNIPISHFFSIIPMQTNPFCLTKVSYIKKWWFQITWNG